MAEFKPADTKKPDAGKPINAKCPVKGEDAKADITYVYQGQTIGFC